MTEIFVSSLHGYYYAVWSFPGSLEDLQRRWPELDAAHRALRSHAEPLPEDAGCGSLEFLVDCSIGTLEACERDADASLRAEALGARVTPKSGAAFTLSWPQRDEQREAAGAGEKPVSALVVFIVLAIVGGMIWWCGEACGRYLSQLARILR